MDTDNEKIELPREDAPEDAFLNAMQELENAMERIKDSDDRSMILLTQDLPEKWTVIVDMLGILHTKEVVMTMDASEVEPEHVMQVLSGRRFLSGFVRMGRECLTLIDDVLDGHESMGRKASSESRTVLDMVHKAILRSREQTERLFRHGHDALEPYAVTQKELLVAIINGFRRFVKQNHRRIEKQLRHHTNFFRPRRTSPLSPEVWEALYKAEETAVDAASAGSLLEDEDYHYLDIDDRLLMEENSKLLERIMLNCIDEELFNFKDAMEMNGLLEDLEETNLLYFYERVHRRNLIQIGMFPNMKEEYDEFLGGNDHPWEKRASQPPSTGGEELPAMEPGVLFTPEAMAMWRKLQKAGMIDEDFQPLQSMRKASVIASVMAGQLGLSPLWEPFEILWDARNLANSYSQAQLGKYYGDLVKEVSKLLI